VYYSIEGFVPAIVVFRVQISSCMVERYILIKFSKVSFLRFNYT